MTKKKIQKKIESKILNSFEDEYYADYFSKLVMFSSKGTNSNARELGIRLEQSDGVNAPYLSVRTMLQAGYSVDLDYSVNAGKAATAFKHLQVAKGRKKNEAMDRPEKIKKIYSDVTQSRLEIGTESIDDRLAQVLVPKDGRYISLTPLFSSGLASQLSDEISKLPEGHFVSRARIDKGGSRPNNIGGLIFKTNRPMFFQAPSENPEVKRAYRVFHNGIPLYSVDREIKKFLRKLDSELVSSRDRRKVSTLETRNSEKNWLHRLVLILKYEVDDSQRLISEFGPRNPESTCSQRLSDIQKYLLDPECRNKGWERTVSEFLADRIGNFIVGEKINRLTQTSTGAFSTILENRIRELF